MNELKTGGTITMQELAARKTRIIVEWFVVDLRLVHVGDVNAIAYLDKFQRLINDGWRVVYEQFISDHIWAARLEREVTV